MRTCCPSLKTLLTFPLLRDNTLCPFEPELSSCTAPLFSTAARRSSEIKGLRWRTVRALRCFLPGELELQPSAACFSNFSFCSRFQRGGQAGTPGNPHLTRVYALTAASVDTKIHSFIVEKGTVAEPGHLLWQVSTQKKLPDVSGKCADGAATSHTHTYPWLPGTTVQLNGPVTL